MRHRYGPNGPRPRCGFRSRIETARVTSPPIAGCVLEAWTGMPASGERARPSLAVAPFAVLDDAGVGRALAEGIADDIAAELARFRELLVLPPGAAMGQG